MAAANVANCLINNTPPLCRRFKPMLHWPAEPDALYTVVISNLDINNRKNRSVAVTQAMKKG